MKILGKRLKQARQNADYNQIEASKKLGISNGTLSGYERDYRDPDTETLHKMARLYDVSVDWLVGRNNDSESKVTEQDEKTAIMNKIAEEFPDADLMFKDLSGISAEGMKDIYEFIKFKKNQEQDK